MVNIAAVRLKLPAAIKVHPTFHVSRVRLVVESDPFPQVDDPPRFGSWTGPQLTLSGRS